MRRRYLLLWPAIAIATGGALLLYGHREYADDVAEAKRAFEAHADSVAALIGEGAREAAISTSLLFELADAREAGNGGVEADRDGGPADAGAPEGDGASEVMDELRREIGIGPLLRGVIRKDVLYVALQDETGILAVAPSAEWVSGWSEDGAPLRAALEGTAGEGASRLRRAKGVEIFERLLPFGMPDDSTVVLRVGIDAGALVGIREKSRNRNALLVAVMIGMTCLVALLTALVWRWQSRGEAAARALEEQRAKSAHWEAIGQMAATVAHEVRNPLNAIDMVSQRLGREFDVGEAERAEFDELLGTLRSESTRVNRVVTGFLELGKPLRLLFEEVDVGEALAEATAPGRLRAERENKELQVDEAPSMGAVLDRARFRQIVGNLVDNALDAVGEGGRVAVRAEDVGAELVVAVRDDGPGLTAEALSEVMRPFVSLRANGTGLGLPLVSRLVEAHGGRFELRSARGAGVEARVILPSRGAASRAEG